MIKTWFPWLVALVLVVAILYGPASTAQGGAPQVPLAQFQCDKGICFTTEAQVDRLEQTLRFLVDKVRELQAKTGCS